MTDETELEALKKRVAELEKAAKPPEPVKYEWKGPRDLTEGMSMSRSAMQAMIDAIPSSQMRGIVNDARKPNPVTGGAPQAQPVQRGSGWVDAKPLTPPEGIKLVDQIAEGFEKRERRRV
jgi:hypothetical protein